ncbi:hypothetical protein EVAR_48287_1 [Eumeta japonica]|uniref:Uncharacterized protein n=1 Tax=Eumeta variegata TaxID=151549 RepID=A0A4C1WNH0_EUMVA|nr:hypothetical protein EVAR_48287_1 [Eumeta japonica]
MTHCRVPPEPSVRARARNESSLFHSIGRCVRVEERQRPHTTYTQLPTHWGCCAMGNGIIFANYWSNTSSGIIFLSRMTFDLHLLPISDPKVEPISRPETGARTGWGQRALTETGFSRDPLLGAHLHIPYAICFYGNCVELDDDISPFDFHVFDLFSIERFDIEEENETSTHGASMADMLAKLLPCDHMPNRHGRQCSYTFCGICQIRKIEVLLKIESLISKERRRRLETLAAPTRRREMGLKIFIALTNRSENRGYNIGRNQVLDKRSKKFPLCRDASACVNFLHLNLLPLIGVDANS